MADVTMHPPVEDPGDQSDDALMAAVAIDIRDGVRDTDEAEEGREVIA